MKTSRYTKPQILAIRAHGMMPLPGNGLPANQERERVVLQVAGEVWREGCVDDRAGEGCRG